jgi:SAM-dependent methyltransferase
VAAGEVQMAERGGVVERISGVDVTEIMRQVREQADKQRQKFTLAGAASPRRNPQTREDLGSLQRTQDLADVRFSSHRKVVGEAIIYAKKLVHQLLTPVLERQSAYNAVNTRLTSYLCDRVERMEGQVASALDALRAEETAFLDALRETVIGQLETVRQQQASALQVLQEEIASQSRERRARERHIALLLEETRKHLAPPPTADPVPPLADATKHMLDTFFAAFDERFRGRREEVKRLLRVYLPPLQEAKVKTEGSPVVDLGSGRGEWLELLQEEGFRASGVDQNHVLVAECVRAGLDVTEGDLLTYLCSIPDQSLGGVTGFHVMEHLPFETLLNLFDETVRVLRPGGVAIFETPNPQNVLVSSQEFYIDPTHRNPLPGALVKFIAEVKGLERVELVPLHPFPDSHRLQEADLEIAKRFNELFYGARDYAVIGWKAGVKKPDP